MKFLVFFIPFIVSVSEAQFYDQSKRELVSVIGEAVVNVPADKCIIDFGIEIQEKDIILAEQKSNDSAKSLISFLKGRGIKENQINSEVFYSRPSFDYKNKEPMIEIRRIYKVTLTDISKIQELISESIKLGEILILNIDFQVADLKKYKDQARSLAIKAATEKAQVMAKDFGATCLKPYSLTEERTYSESWYGYWNSWWGGRGRALQSQNVAFDGNGGGKESDNTILPGQIAVRASVHASFSHSVNCQDNLNSHEGS